MTFVFPWPISPGEWLAWWGAVATILFGLAVLLVPSLALAGGLAPGQALPPSARAAIRAYAGGMLIGLGLSAILFAQPLIYAALGFA